MDEIDLWLGFWWSIGGFRSNGKILKELTQNFEKDSSPSKSGSIINCEEFQSIDSMNHKSQLLIIAEYDRRGMTIPV